MNTKPTFDDLWQYIPDLPKPEQWKKTCTVCGGHSLIYKPGKGYQCTKNDCDTKEIFKSAIALSPWANNGNNGKHIPTPKRAAPSGKGVSKTNLHCPDTLPTGFDFGRLENPTIPQDIKQPGDGLSGLWYYVYEVNADGKPTKRVERKQWLDNASAKGYEKKVFPRIADAEGNWLTNTTTDKKGRQKVEPLYSKGTEPCRPAYRIGEVLAHLQQDRANNIAPIAFLHEGEKGVDIVRSHHAPAFCFQGASWQPKDILPTLQQIKDTNASTIVLFPIDNDDAGVKKGEYFLAACSKVGICGIVINHKDLHAEMPIGGDVEEGIQLLGWDDYIAALKREMTDELEGRIVEQESAKYADDEGPSIEDNYDAADGEPQRTFAQVVQQTLYAEDETPWVHAEGNLYKWQGNYFKLSNESVEIKRVAAFCNTYAVFDPKTKKSTYPHANDKSVKAALAWVQDLVSIDEASINPPGLNCTNGVLQLKYGADSIPAWELIPHAPAITYLYQPMVEFNPEADPTECDRLLECLDPPQREIFLRTIAASLDLRMVRRKWGRLTRALFAVGDGSNGKDTLREVVRLLYDTALTGCSIADFKQYDQGRKFPLARLIKSRANWSSENGDIAVIDGLQSLKAAITGDTLSYERKGKDEAEFDPAAIFIFNCNNVPNLRGRMQAISSRFAILEFNKTYVVGADPSKGELEADPRFKYDIDFLRTEVLPAFLNKILQAYVDLMREGIDYAATNDALQAAAKTHCHLLQFCADTGLEFTGDMSQSLSAAEIWEHLRQWYIENGTLTIEENAKGGEKLVWCDQADKYDRNCKAVNQVIARFAELFPKAVVGTRRESNNHYSKILKGLQFAQLTAKTGLSDLSDLETSQHQGSPENNCPRFDLETDLSDLETTQTEAAEWRDGKIYTRDTKLVVTVGGLKGMEMTATKPFANKFGEPVEVRDGYGLPATWPIGECEVVAEVVPTAPSDTAS